MKNCKKFLSQIFYLYIPILLCICIVLFFLIARLRNDLIFISILLFIFIIYIIIFTILNLKYPEVFSPDLLWREDAGAAWQKKTIKKIQNFSLKIDNKIKDIFKK